MSVDKKRDVEDVVLAVFSILFLAGVAGMITGIFLPYGGYNWGLRILITSGITAVISALICMALTA